MFHQILALLLDVATGLFGGACLLRLYMQYQRVPFGNPVGHAVFALTDWLVLPLRRLLPSVRGLDTASLVGAWVVVMVQAVTLWGLGGAMGSPASLPLLALFMLARLALSGLTGLVILGALLSWVRADSLVADVVDRLCAPLLRPFRRLIPLVGGLDLSPLALLVVLQVAGIVLGSLQAAILA